jgi:hypothetical protein
VPVRIQRIFKRTLAVRWDKREKRDRPWLKSGS